MDASVLRSMARWPDVPALYGWLSLDRRGRWRLRGQHIEHPLSVGFINRHYAHDQRGCYFFQNGPQRVFVSLEVTPWIFQMDARGVLHSHTGVAVTQLTDAWLDDEANFYVKSNVGPGLIDDRTLPEMANHLCDREGHPLDEADLDRFCATGEKSIFCHYGDQRIVVNHLDRDKIEETLGFLAEPTPDSGGDPKH